VATIIQCNGRKQAAIWGKTVERGIIPTVRFENELFWSFFIGNTFRVRGALGIAWGEEPKLK